MFHRELTSNASRRSSSLWAAIDLANNQDWQARCRMAPIDTSITGCYVFIIMESVPYAARKADTNWRSCFVLCLFLSLVARLLRGLQYSEPDHHNLCDSQFSLGPWVPAPAGIGKRCDQAHLDAVIRAVRRTRNSAGRSRAYGNYRLGLSGRKIRHKSSALAFCCAAGALSFRPLTAVCIPSSWGPRN